MLGNAWEWAEDHLGAFPGFKVHPFYEDFSSPCFGGKHQLVGVWVCVMGGRRWGAASTSWCGGWGESGSGRSKVRDTPRTGWFVGWEGGDKHQQLVGGSEWEGFRASSDRGAQAHYQRQQIILDVSSGLSFSLIIGINAADPRRLLHLDRPAGLQVCALPVQATLLPACHLPCRVSGEHCRVTEHGEHGDWLGRPVG